MLRPIFTRGESAKLDPFLTHYGQLRKIARQELDRMRGLCSMESAEAVNQAFLRIATGESAARSSSQAQLRISAVAIRRAIIDHARRKSAQVRGGHLLRCELAPDISAVLEPDLDLEALDEALNQLDEFDTTASLIVNLRFFSDLNFAQISEHTGLSVDEVDRTWKFARAWLRSRVENR